MAKRQAELPNTRLPGEPPPPKSIKALDDALEEWERAKGKATKASQLAREKRNAAMALLVDAGLMFYLYDDLEGVEQRFFRRETVGKCKEKKAKRRPDDESEDDAEAS